MSSATPAPVRQDRGRMARLILIIFLPLSLLPVIIAGGILFYLNRDAFKGLNPSLVFTGIFLFAVGFALVGLIIYLTAKHLTSPLAELATTMQLFIDGNWEKRSWIDSPHEIGSIAGSFNKIADEMVEIYWSLTQHKARQNAGKKGAFTQLAHLATSAQDLDGFLGRAVELLIQHFDLIYASVYLIERDDPSGPPLVVLHQASGAPEFASSTLGGRFENQKISLDFARDADWLVGKSLQSKQPQSSSTDTVEGLFEAAIPLVLSGQVLGVLDLFASTRNVESRLGPFSIRTISQLQILASVMALAVSNLTRSDEPGPDEAWREMAPTDVAASDANHIGFDLGEANLLYQAGNQIAQAETEEQVLSAVTGALEQTTYAAAILLAEGDELRLSHRWSGKGQPVEAPIGDHPPVPIAAINPYFIPPEGSASSGGNGKAQSEPPRGARPILVTDLGASRLPHELLDAPRRMGCDSVAFLPVLRQENIAAMLVLGRVSEPLEGSSAQPVPALTGVMLGPYINLIELMATALEKIQAQKGTQRRLAELQMLWNVSQTISIETDLKPLFRTIHKQAEEVMGELSSFAMALYDDGTDTIRIPYMFEEGQMVDIPPFPLGEGLTSIIVRTRRPLMLVEDTEEKAQELGAKTYGVPAKSWLGVPMLFGGQVVGAIIAQDINQEQRFNEGDQRLLSTLAAQVAVVVRNARLLETSRQQTELERSLNEIINKVRLSTDIPTILKTTADELGAVLGVRRAHIKIAIDSPAQGSQAAGSQIELSRPGSTDGGE